MPQNEIVLVVRKVDDEWTGTYHAADELGQVWHNDFTGQDLADILDQVIGDLAEGSDGGCPQCGCDEIIAGEDNMPFCMACQQYVNPPEETT